MEDIGFIHTGDNYFDVYVFFNNIGKVSSGYFDYEAYVNDGFLSAAKNIRPLQPYEGIEIPVGTKELKNDDIIKVIVDPSNKIDEEDEGNNVKEEKIDVGESDIHILTCEGRVTNSLCDNNIDPLYFEDGSKHTFWNGALDEIKVPNPINYEDFIITFDYQPKIYEDEDLVLKIKLKNTGTVEKKLYYSYITHDEFDEFGKELEKTEFIGSIEHTDTKNVYFEVSLKPNEEKQATYTFRNVKQNTLREYFLILFYSINKDELIRFDGPRKNLFVIVQPKQGIECGGRIFPESIPFETITGLTFGYEQETCCNNVFYPQAECCNDNVCKNIMKVPSACIDGKCIEVFNPKEFSEILKLKREIKLLAIDFDETKELCADVTSQYSDVIDYNEQYWDRMVRHYLKKDENYMNFNWKIITGLKLDGTKTLRQNAEEAAQICGYNFNNFDTVIVVVKSNFGARGWAGNPIVMESLNQPSVTHEISHNFGCDDLYYSSAANYQFANSIHSPIHNPHLSLISKMRMPVCYARIGWGDTNRNNIIDIFEFETGLVAHYKFDEGSGSIAIDSAGNNDGIIYGAEWVDGKKGKALRFDGRDDYIEVDDDPSLDIDKEITISAWIKPEKCEGEQVIFAKLQHSNTGGLSYGLRIRNGHIRAEYGDYYDNDETVTNCPSTGQWHHIASTWTPTTKKLYIDGIERYSATSSLSTRFNTDKKLIIGDFRLDANSWNQYFKGIIDEIKIYNRALTEEEIIKEAGLSVSCTGSADGTPCGGNKVCCSGGCIGRTKEYRFSGCTDGQGNYEKCAARINEVCGAGGGEVDLIKCEELPGCEGYAHHIGSGKCLETGAHNCQYWCYVCPQVKGVCSFDRDCSENQFCEFDQCSAETGKCVDIPENCIDSYEPVCGCDGKTYSNDCYRGTVRVSKAYDGECLTEGAYFEFDYPPRPDTFIFKLTNPEKIQEARDILAGRQQDAVHVMGYIKREAVSYNLPYDYHLDPDSISFFEAAMELCDAGIFESYPEEFCEQYPPGQCTWCPWGSRLVREVQPDIKCTDSDGGLDYFQYGECQDKDGDVKKDDCDTLVSIGPLKLFKTNTLIEYSCNKEGYCDKVKVDCKKEFGDDYICEKGDCRLEKKKNDTDFFFFFEKIFAWI